jgi:hypothetical protein
MRKEGFYCPHCSVKVSNEDNSIVFLKGRLDSETFTIITDVSLPAQLGVYGAIFSEGIILKPGAEVNFICPHCVIDLTMSSKEQYAAIKMIDGQGRQRIVVFNRFYGKHASFIFDLDSHSLVSSYGEHQNNFSSEFDTSINFFGA